MKLLLSIRRKTKIQVGGHIKEISIRDQPENNDMPYKQVEKHLNLFSLENEISKLKVSIPLTELIKIYQYKFHVSKRLKVNQISNMVNVSDDHPEILFDRVVDGNLEDN